MKLVEKLPAPLKRIIDFVRNAVGRFFRTDCATRAAGLTLYTFLAIVPVLCCVLVLAKVCGVDRFAREQIDSRLDAAICEIERGQDDALLTALAPANADALEKRRIAASEFATEARRISHDLFARIERFDVGTLGWIGFGFLLWTVISSLSVVEESFNRIWGVVRPRPLWRRVFLYLFLLVVLPVLSSVALSLPLLGAVKSVIVATMGSTAWTRWASDGLVVVLDSFFFRVVLTLLASSVSLGFFYWILPNHPVRFSRAWAGGLAAAVALAAWVRLCAVAQVGIAKSSALYGGFALLPIVLAWVHISWQIVLFAACLVKEGERQSA